MVLLLLTEYEVAHFKTFKRELHLSILFLLHAFEPLQINDQNGWSLINLDLFNSLLMHFTSTAKPSILM